MAKIRSELSDWAPLSDELARRLEESDDDLDALLCALVALAVEAGRSEPIPDDAMERAEREGWIHLPRAEPLAVLRPPV